MIKLSFKSKTLTFLTLIVFAFGIFGFGDDNEIKYNSVRNINAEDGFSCKGPADVVLVIDRAATMSESGKFGIVKTASINFINKLFLSTPNGIYGENAYHQIGLVAFHNFIDSEALNRNNGSYMQGVINQSDGILGDDYPVGNSRTSSAIIKARDNLDPFLSSVNPLATRTMIVLTDGSPDYDLASAKANADSAKDDKGIRIISVGLKLDSIADEAKRTEAENFIKYIASAPYDCYYVSDSGGSLADCNSISAANLEEALGDVYTNITAAICDESSPTISISKKPFGTLYNVDNLVITSTASDDVGFKSHSIEWSDNWTNPDDLQSVECGNLTGTVIGSEVVIECDTGNIGTFTTGTGVSYRSLVTDANDNEATIDSPDPRNVIVANVNLTFPALLRNADNTIQVEISNYGGNDNIFVSIDAPVLAGIEIDKAPMNCSEIGSDRTCVYNFNTVNVGDGCLNWTDGITNGFANNINVNIYIYAQSADVGIRQIASSENNLLASSSEGDDWAGTCSDSINNDCDYDISGDPIIDTEEMLCDTGNPIVGISRVPSGIVYDDDMITFTSVAGDDMAYNNGIKQHTIYYKIDNGPPQIAFVCNDANADNSCDEDASQNIANISATIGLFVAGTTIDYYSTAIDYSGNNNTTTTATESFIVKNKTCEGIVSGECCQTRDINGICILYTADSACCEGICNTVISNPNSYDTDFCAQKICNGISWEWGVANDTAICSTSGDATECHSFSDLYGPAPGIPPYYFDGGCEERNYRCSAGFCDFGTAIIKKDHCVGGGSLVLNDYECSGNSCVLDPVTPVDNNICDVNVDSLSVNAYNSTDVLISGSSGFIDGEVLDDLTNKVSLKSSTSDTSGISEQKIFWKESTDASFNVNDCNISSCEDNSSSCSCVKDIGPLNIGEEVVFYASSKDNNVNQAKHVKGPSGLRYYYYSGEDFNDDTKYLGTDIDTDINHDWGWGAVKINNSNSWENRSDYVGVIWEGFVKPDCLGDHNFYFSIEHYDKIKVYLDGNEIVDNWSLQWWVQEFERTYNFTSLDPVPIRIEWYEHYGRAKLELGWESPCGSKVYPIPADNLIASYSFDVYDHECYDVPGGNKPDLTPCDSENGMCCSGTCDSTPAATSYNEECRVNSCSGTNWIYAISNAFGDTKEGDQCGGTNTCFDYYSPFNDFYSGCLTGGNKCSSGQCNTLSTSTSYPTCDESLLTDYDCTDYATGTCEEKSSNIDCSVAGTYDGDDVDCNCDCNNYDIEEKVYSSLEFDGLNDYVEIPSDTSLNSEEITLEAWVYPTVFNSHGNIITKRYPAQYILRFYSNTGRIQAFIHDGGWRYCTTTIAASLNQWNHIVHTYDGSKGRTYINGVEDTGGCPYSYTGAIDSGDAPLRIGSYNTTTTSSQRIKGRIDEVRIYDRTLYPEEVQAHYDGIFADDTGLVGYWDFDEGAGDIVEDSSGNGNDGTLESGPEWMRYYHGSASGVNGNVPENWQVCTDGKDNDCDGDFDDYDDITGVSNCDGEVHAVGFTAKAMDRACVTNPGCTEGSDLFPAGNAITVDDMDIERTDNDFTIKTLSDDDFLIKETEIEWTTDNWVSKSSKTCTGIGAEVCEVCIEGGACGEDNDDILLSSLVAGNTFSFRVCAWDNSVNSNLKCTDYHSIVIENSNSAPEITDLLVRSHNFCADGLGYFLEWEFEDTNDSQESYEIQIKEGDNNFADVNELVVNVKKDNNASEYYQILSADFINSKEIDYGNETYYWRARVTDSRGGGYEKTSDWVEYNDSSDSDGDGDSATFTTPIYKYPQVDFSATPDYSEVVSCLYETGYETIGAEDMCAYGENIVFSDDSIFINCNSPNNKQCITSSAVNCDVSTGFCVACTIDNDCNKFNSSLSYSCIDEICEPSGSCADDIDCKTADAAKCDIDAGLCVACDDDTQCSNDKFGTTGVNYFCSNIGKCDNKDYREWYFYGSDAGDPDSVDSNPINNYIHHGDFVFDDYSVILKVTDINNNQCYKIKKILLGGEKYPKWNEAPAKE